MLKAFWKKYTLNFKRPSGTSRGVLTDKTSWFIFIYDDENPETIGTGECGLLKGLSCDDVYEYENVLEQTCKNIQDYKDIFNRSHENYPSIRFGIEMALLDLENNGQKILFPSAFSSGEEPININGLIWMGDPSFMKEQIKEKLKQGFSCIKMKIGAIDFNQELSILKAIRKEFSPEEIELRVDANGAFAVEDALTKLNQLADFKLHSIEQPIKAGQWEEMTELCKTTPLPIALDEELIGIHKMEKKKDLIKRIKPQYIILKPSLIGGFKSSQEWIDMAETYNCGWWITSALESNIGLNAIAQWTYTLNNKMPQGLGTGQLYTNNFPSPLQVAKGKLHFRTDTEWNLNQLI